tara:strand:- start:81 stop:410 length:330 start_codon:yes stop_codon:yes gene_type:complete
MSLKESKCEACRMDAPKVTDIEKQDFLKELTGWRIINNSGVDHLFKAFTFRSYKDASSFAQKVAELAELEDHHPKIILEYGKVEVYWWSHKIEGLHKNDFICAAKTDLL